MIGAKLRVALTCVVSGNRPLARNSKPSEDLKHSALTTTKLYLPQYLSVHLRVNDLEEIENNSKEQEIKLIHFPTLNEQRELSLKND